MGAVRAIIWLTFPRLVGAMWIALTAAAARSTVCTSAFGGTRNGTKTEALFLSGAPLIDAIASAMFVANAAPHNDCRLAAVSMSLALSTVASRAPEFEMLVGMLMCGPPRLVTATTVIVAAICPGRRAVQYRSNAAMTIERIEIASETTTVLGSDFCLRRAPHQVRRRMTCSCHRERLHVALRCPAQVARPARWRTHLRVMPQGPFYPSGYNEPIVPTQVFLRLRFAPSEPPLGPGKIELMEQIERSGSIAAAARAMRMSYHRASTIVNEINVTFREPLVAAQPGGVKGGGARITPLGRDVVRRFRSIETSIRRHAARHIAALEASAGVGRR